MEQGRAEGLSEGLERGAIQGQVQMAHRMFTEKIPFEVVRKVVDSQISDEELHRLAEAALQ